MKLAFCLFKYFPFGGLQRDFLSIAKECLSRGHEVDVFTMAWEGEREPGLSVTILPVNAYQNHTRTKKFTEKVLPLVRQHDLIVGFNKMAGLDVYYAADTCYQAKAHSQRSFLYRFMPRYRKLVAAERAVFSSEVKTNVLLISHAEQSIFQNYYGTPKERFYLLPPGISKDRIAPSNAADIRKSMRKKLGLSDNEFLLLIVGSGFKTKGLDRVILSVASLPKALREKTHLFIVGKDNPKRFIKQAKNHDILDRIHFLGGRDDVPQLLLAGDLLLHPAYNENTGTVLLEALTAGLPVLTTDICGYAHYVKEAQAGYVIPSPFCQKQFNQRLENALLSSERIQWQKNAIHFGKTADIYDMPLHAVNFIESLKGKEH